MPIRMKSLALPLLSAAALALGSCTQILQAAWTPPTRDPARLQAGTYAIEPTHTQILFSVLHFGFTTYYGTFSGVSGSLLFDPGSPSKMSVSVSIPAASVATTSTKLDANLKGADWLDAAKYPVATFTSTAISLKGSQSADIAGVLTLHGISRQVTLHAIFNGAGINPLDQKETLGFQLSGQIRRSDFGVSKLVPLVSDEVDLVISVAFEKQGSGSS